MRVLFPFYRGVIENDKDTFRAFAFKTSIDAGRVNPDRKVLKIDYNSPENPAFSIRRILDEVVQVKEGIYLQQDPLQMVVGNLANDRLFFVAYEEVKLYGDRSYVPPICFVACSLAARLSA